MEKEYSKESFEDKICTPSQINGDFCITCFNLVFLLEIYQHTSTLKVQDYIKFQKFQKLMISMDTQIKHVIYFALFLVMNVELHYSTAQAIKDMPQEWSYLSLAQWKQINPNHTV